MAKKQQHVPETKGTDVKLNREQRRHPEKIAQPEDANLSRETAPQDDLQDQDVPASTKVTADKWNQ